MSQQK